MGYTHYLAILALVYSAYYVITAARHIFFHALSKYPGPFFARFSGWPSFWHTLKGDRHIWIWQLHQVYGPIVRYSYDSVTIGTPEALHAIFDTKSNVQKTKSYIVWQKVLKTPNTFSCVNKTEHSRRRKILNSVLSDATIRSAEQYILSHTNRWLTLLGEDNSTWSEPRNMSDWANALQFDIMAELCYGKSFDTKEPGENSLRSIPHDITEYMWFNFRIMHSPFIHVWIWLKSKGLVDAIIQQVMPKKVRHYLKFVDDCVIDRLEQEQSMQSEGKDALRKDMLHYLFKAIDPETGKRGYDRPDLVEEASVLTVGGTDTTAASIAATFFYLVRNPRVYRKLRDEIRSKFQSAEDIKMGSQINSCTYLRTVINESLRMSPAGPSEFPREVLPGGLMIGEEMLPPGIHVGCGFYALFHDENIYKDPFVFRPERWIVGEDVTEEDVAAAKEAFAPFSLGNRGCPGKGLALVEMSIIFARTIYKYDFRLAPDDRTGEGHSKLGWGRHNKGQYQARDAFVPLRDGPYVQFAQAN